jgi:hypothetical protein
MPRGREKWQKSRNHNFIRQRRYRAPFSFALQSDHAQYPAFNVGDFPLLQRQRRIEEASKGAIPVASLQPCRCCVGGLLIAVAVFPWEVLLASDAEVVAR